MTNSTAPACAQLPPRMHNRTWERHLASLGMSRPGRASSKVTRMRLDRGRTASDRICNVGLKEGGGVRCGKLSGNGKRDWKGLSGIVYTPH